MLELGNCSLLSPSLSISPYLTPPSSFSLFPLYCHSFSIMAGHISKNISLCLDSIGHSLSHLLLSFSIYFSFVPFCFTHTISLSIIQYFYLIFPFFFYIIFIFQSFCFIILFVRCVYFLIFFHSALFFSLDLTSFISYPRFMLFSLFSHSLFLNKYLFSLSIILSSLSLFIYVFLPYFKIVLSLSLYLYLSLLLSPSLSLYLTLFLTLFILSKFL